MSTTSADSVQNDTPLPSAQTRFEDLKRRVCYRNTTVRFFERLTDAEKKKLGKTVEKAWTDYHNAPNMWQKLHGGSSNRAVTEVARSLGWLSPADTLWLLREYNECPQIKSANAEVAIGEGGLVINLHPRAVYWKGQSIRCDWNNKHNKSFEILVAAARKAKRGQALCPRDLESDPNMCAISKKLYRLKNIPGFPWDLGDLFVPDKSVSEPGSQRLDLPRLMIHVFEFESPDY